MATQSVRERQTDQVPVLCPPMFVGRSRELAELDGALAKPPTVVLVEGEAGIGKSRLLQEFLASPAGRAGRTLLAGCPPLREPLTLGAVVDAVRQATESVRGLPLSGLAGALRPLFPEWADDLPPMPEPAEDARAARHRLFRALIEVLGCLDVSVLVVEDVHWADEATLEFLLFLTARRREDLSVVVTYRPEDVPSDSLLLRLSSRLPAGTTSLRLTLQPLDVVGTAELVSSMLAGEGLSEQFAKFLHRHTEGLPLAVEESVRVMYERADLTCRNGEWVRRDVRWIEVPPTIRDAVLERAGRLGPDAQAVLRAVAVLADPADEAAIVAVAGLAADAVRVGLAEARRCGLVREDARGLVSFRHVLASRAVYDDVPAAERRILHLRSGEALEARSPLPVARLASHFREAGDIDRWCRYGEQAADAALLSGDEASAAVLLYDLVVHAGRSARDVARLMNKIPLMWFAGNTRFRSLLSALHSLVDDSGLRPEEEAEVRYQLGRLLAVVVDWNAARAALERAVPHLGHDAAALTRAMTLLGAPRGSDCPASEHLRWLRRAAEVTMTTSGEHLSVLVNRVTALLLLGEEEGWGEAARIPEDAPTAHDQLQVTRGQLNFGGMAMLWGRYGEASRRIERALRLTSDYQYARLHGIALVTKAHLDWFTGAWRGLTERAASLASNDDAPEIRPGADLVSGLLLAAAGSDARAVECLEQALAGARAHGGLESRMEVAAALARVWLSRGWVENALQVTDWPIGVVTNKGVWIWATDLGPVRVEALLANGQIAEAADLVAAFARGLRGRNAPAPKAAVVLCRAMMAEAKGEHQRAATTYARAAAAWDALPRPYDALLARERQARCLLEVGRSENGLDLLAQIAKGLSGLGARGDADRVVRTLRENGVRVRRSGAGRPSYGDQLSPRELEVVRLLATGKTNQQIADALVLSPKTVACHVDSSMHKLKAGSRTALVWNAVKAGVVSVGSVDAAQ